MGTVPFFSLVNPMIVLVNASALKCLLHTLVLPVICYNTKLHLASKLHFTFYNVQHNSFVYTAISQYVIIVVVVDIFYLQQIYDNVQKKIICYKKEH